MIDLIYFDTKWDADNHTTIMVMIDGKPVGTCMVDHCNKGEHKGQALLWNLQVQKRYRRKGIGYALLDKAIQCAEEKGCSEIRLVWRSVDSPEWVLRWYERKGFDECAFGNGIVEMRLVLKGGEE